MNQIAHQLADFLLRRKEVERIAGISRASIYRLIKAGKFPAPVSLGTGSVRRKPRISVAPSHAVTYPLRHWQKNNRGSTWRDNGHPNNGRNKPQKSSSGNRGNSPLGRTSEGKGSIIAKCYRWSAK